MQKDEKIMFNKALIKIKKNSGIKNNEIISEATGIDTSTTSLHFTGKRKINIEQAYSYARFFNVHIIKILDENITQYPVVAYCNDEGLVRLRNEDEWEVVLAPNDTENDGTYCIHQKNAKTIFWYNPKILVEKKDAINIFCYLKNHKGNYIGLVNNYLNNNKYKIFNYHTFKYFNAKIDKCYPITNTSHLDFSKYHKVKALIN
tara:strand:+ start:1032 stop:1640 length:609 start_codon:yes stop_codon:yes gene_type:complete